MTKKETIQVLQSIEDRAVDFPYMTACDWVAIAAAKRHLENALEVKEVDLEKDEPVSNDLEKAAVLYNKKINFVVGGEVPNQDFIAGAQWQKEHLWKDAQGDDLPEIDREVIALLSNGKVVYAHRPQEYWDGKNIATGEVTRYYPKRYDKGGWNSPNIKYWLDLELPKMEE